MLNISQVAQQLNVNRNTIMRWRDGGVLTPADSDDNRNYSEAGIAALAAAMENDIDRSEYQAVYDRAANPNGNVFSVPSEDTHNQIVQENVKKLKEYGGTVTMDKFGGMSVKPNIENWVAYLLARYDGELVADQDTNKLWLESYEKGKYTLSELPIIPSLLYDASHNWNLDDTASSNKKLEDAFAQVATMVRRINPYEERLKTLRENWDGKERLDTIFQDLLASPQDPEILKQIAHTWFNGAIHNWTRHTSDLVFPMMLDINATAQGTGKSFFFNIINGIMTGVDGKADAMVEGDLNDPANIYPQLVGKAVVNDDEHRVYNASQPSGRQSSGSDVNAAYKNWITLDTLEWIPKHSNQVKRIPVRYVLGRTSNIAKPYNDNDTTEVDRRYLTVRGGAFNKIKLKSVSEYVDYMKQVLGEAMAKFHWDSATDANMSPELRDAMRLEQIMGSKQGDGWEFINEIMNQPISLDFYSLPIVDIQAYLAGTAPFMATSWHDTTLSKDARFVRPRAIAGALFKMSQAIGTKTTKDQSEALTQKWLAINGFVEYGKHDFKWKGAHYQGDFMFNDDNDQYSQGIIDHSVDDIIALLPTINPMTTSTKELKENLKVVVAALDDLNDGVISDNLTKVHRIQSAIHAAIDTL